MTSDRARGANRRNAQSSTGPKTPQGKARSAQNARKHGLSAKSSTSQEDAELSRFAELIAGERKSDPALLSVARSVAEAQAQLQRIRDFRMNLMQSESAASQTRSRQVDIVCLPMGPQAFSALETIEHYERRALSRRKSLIRRFAAIASESEGTFDETLTGGS